MDGKLRLLVSPTLLARNTPGESHVLLCLFDIKAMKFFLVGADVVSREALNNVTERTEIDTLHEMRVEAPGNRFPRFATLFDSGGQTIPVCSQGSTRDPPLCFKGSRGVCKNGLPSLGASTTCNFFELIKRNKRVDIVHHVAVLNI